MHALSCCGVIFLEGSWTGGHITRRCIGQLFRCAPKLPVSLIVGHQFAVSRHKPAHIFNTHQGINSMKIASFLTLTAALLISGCASVEMASKAESAKGKEFNPPSQGNAGVYIYRDSFVGKALKKDIWIDGKCIGESAPDVFFHTEVEGGKNHKFDTESEFSSNTLDLMFESGKNYFIRQFIKMGVFVGGAGLEQIPEEQGKKDVAKLEMAKPGKCSAPR